MSWATWFEGFIRTLVVMGVLGFLYQCTPDRWWKEWLLLLIAIVGVAWLIYNPD
jgi:hypothetical protein